MKRLLMTYCNNEQKMAEEELFKYRNSLVFDTDRNSIYAQNLEFGYVSNVNFCTYNNLNTPSELYNSEARESSQIITNIHFDKHNGLSYTCSDLKTNPLSQSANIGNTIVTLSLKDGYLTLESYKPAEITGIQLTYGDVPLNKEKDVDGIYPIDVNKNIMFDSISTYISTSNETPTYQSIMIDNVFYFGECLEYSRDSALDFGDITGYEFVKENEQLSQSKYYNTVNVFGNIPYKGVGETVDVYVALEDNHQRLTNPPSVTLGKITFGWFYPIYYTTQEYKGQTGAEFENWFKTVTTMFIQNNSKYILQHDSMTNVVINLSSQRSVDPTSQSDDTVPTYVYIPYDLERGNDLDYEWNGGTYSGPPDIRVINGSSVAIVTINGLQFNIHVFDENYDVHAGANAEKITLLGYRFD